MSARRPQPVLLAAGLALVLLALLGLAWLRAGAGAAQPAAPGREAQQPQQASPAPLATPVAPGPSVALSSEPDPVRPRVRMLSAVDRSPAAGVRLYTNDGPIAGPSGDRGWLEIPEREVGGVWTAWGPGWAAQRLGSRPPFPEEVLLEPAAAGLRVSVRSSDPGARIVRTRLVAIGRPGTPEQPWAPRLEIHGPLGAGSGQLPPGPYDVYVWILRGSDAPRILPRQRVELEQGRTLDLELDADALTAPEPDG